MTAMTTATEDPTAVAAYELAQAERALAALRAERDGLTSQRRDAAERVDSAALLTLTYRADEITTEVAVAEVAVLAAKIASLEAQLPAAETEYRDAFAAMNEAEERHAETGRALTVARNRSASANEDRRSLKADLGRLRRELTDAVTASGRASRRAR